MFQKIFKTFEKLSRAELLRFKKELNIYIENRFKKDLWRRSSRRVKTKTQATCIIEREKEFFVKEHKITIQEMSVNGMIFRTSAAIYENDIIDIKFRSPSTGEVKYIYCQVLRIKEIKEKTGVELEVAAKAVDDQAVKAYKDMLNKRIF